MQKVYPAEKRSICALSAQTGNIRGPFYKGLGQHPALSAGMIGNSFFQKVFLTMFWGLCAAGLIQFYTHMVWQANEDINGAEAQKELYSDSRARMHHKSNPK